MTDVLDSGRYVLGPQLEAFEHEFAAYCGVRHCIGVGSGLDALHLALRAAGVGPGDEVIVPGNTFIATWLAVSAAEATPVPVDPDPTTHNVDADGIASAITERTRAIVPVHLYGYPAPMEEITAVARRHGLWVVEDAAQAHGARARGVRAGAFGDAGAFSFYPAKNLGGFGDGGAVTTDDPGLAETVKMLRNYGCSSKYEHELAGTNSRLDEIQAAFLRVLLRRLSSGNARRRALATRYREGLSDGELGLPPPDGSGVEPTHHLFVVRSSRRDELRGHLTDRGIETMVHYPKAPHQQKAYAGTRAAENSLPVAERLQEEVLSLPLYPALHEREIDEVIEACRTLDELPMRSG